MDIRKLKIFMLLPLAFILLGCPGEDFSCVTQNIRIENLAKIEPVQEVYHLGDTLIYSVAIPSHIENFNGTGDTVNIFQETGVMETLYGGSGIYNFQNNEITILQGTTEVINETLVANVTYYPETNDYRFKAKVVFTQTGNYSLGALNDTRLIFNPENDDCAEYEIKTSTQGIDPNGDFNFTVEE